MKTKIAGIAAIVCCLLFAAMPLQKSFANDMTTILVPEHDSAQATFNSIINVELHYPPDSPIAKELNGVQERILLNASGSAGQNKDADSALTAFNRAFIEANSTVQTNNMTINYSAKIDGEADTTLISYVIHSKPILQKFVLTRNNSTGNSVIDLEWRKVSLRLPIYITDPKLGQVDINHPIGIIKARFPDLAAKLENTGASDILNQPIMDFSTFNVGMDRWHFLFDPTGNLVESSSYLSGSSDISKVVSVYSLGESSFREGTFVSVDKNIPVTVDGTNVVVHSSVPPPSGQLSITGYSSLSQSGGGWVAQVSKNAPEGATTSSGDFPFQVLLIFGGMMGAIAVFILFKARK